MTRFYRENWPIDSANNCFVIEHICAKNDLLQI